MGRKMNLDSLSALIPLLLLQEEERHVFFPLPSSGCCWLGRVLGVRSVFEDCPLAFTSERYWAVPHTDAIWKKVFCCGPILKSWGKVWPWGMWDLGSPTGDQTCTLCVGRWCLDHWTSREAPLHWCLDVVLYWLIAWSCVTFGFLNIVSQCVLNIYYERVKGKKVSVTQSCPTLCDPMAPLSLGFSRQEYWSELPFPSLGDLPYPGIKPGSPALQAASLPTELS